MPQSQNRRKVARKELEVFQGMCVAFREACQETMERMANGNQDNVPANEIAMWGSHLTIAQYMAEVFIQDAGRKIDQLDGQQGDALLYLPENGGIIDA